MTKGKMEDSIEEKFFKQPDYIRLVDGMTKKKKLEFKKKVLKRYFELMDLIEYIDSTL